MKNQKRIFMATVFIFLFFFGIIVFWGFQAIGEEWTDEQKEVWKSVQANWENYKKGDVGALLAVQHDMVTWWVSKPEPLRKIHMKQSYRNWFDYDKPVSYKLRPLAITIFNNIANVFYIYKWNGNILSDKGRSFETWVKQDNKWLAIGGLTSSCDTLPSFPYAW
ncbi:MAG: nuclear transport factor 2 family protein [Nitrospinales bacterium]